MLYYGKIFKLFLLINDMNNGMKLLLVLTFALLIVLPFASAGWFSNFCGKLTPTGKAVAPVASCPGRPDCSVQCSISNFASPGWFGGVNVNYEAYAECMSDCCASVPPVVPVVSISAPSASAGASANIASVSSGSGENADEEGIGCKTWGQNSAYTLCSIWIRSASQQNTPYLISEEYKPSVLTYISSTGSGLPDKSPNNGEELGYWAWKYEKGWAEKVWIEGPPKKTDEPVLAMISTKPTASPSEASRAQNIGVTVITVKDRHGNAIARSYYYAD